MEDFIKDMLAAAVKRLPAHWIASYFKKRTSPEVAQTRNRAGGFLKGVCHCKEDFTRIKDAGLEWEREDIPFPFDERGKLREDYIKRKAEWRLRQEAGVRIMAITPFPEDYIKHGGIDPRLPENEARIREIAVFLLGDLGGIVSAVQVSNEIGVPRFTLPLNMEQGARFLGIQLEAMHPRRGDILIGYNAVMIQCDLHARMQPWLKYCDYVGTDIYIGCFAPVGNWMAMYDVMLRYLWSMTRKPIIITEFGYISGGAPKTPAEKGAVLRRYGVSSEKEAREKIDMFMENVKQVNPEMHEYVTKHASGGYADFLFKPDFCNHFYSELPRRTVIKKYPHTARGQADFYEDIFSRLARLPFVIGAFVYCWKDDPKCHVCNQNDCPTETRWGLVDTDGGEKLSFFAVKDALEKIIQK